MDGLEVFNRQDEECPDRNGQGEGNGLHVFGRLERREVIDERGNTLVLREVICRYCGKVVKRELIPAEQT